ncbi:MAG: DUF4435 domain-containing protein [Saprospiraceae bacterium]|nr:DUF4435 domain-containing protein [Saprospiraceae bacterium]
MKGFSIKDEVRRLKDEVFFLRLDAAVRVEGEEDKPFWEAAFKTAVPQHKIRIFAESNYPTVGSTGKSNVLEFRSFADNELLLCVDADYDYLLQSKAFLSTPYIFHTYAFSIENFFCNPAALWAIYLAAGGKADEAFDFEGFMKEYSRIIHPLFLLSVVSEKENDGVFGLKKCGSAVCPPFDWMAEMPVEDWLEKVRQRIAAQVSEIQPKLKNLNSETWEKQLSDLGATPENTCWFVRGHNWMAFMEQFVALSVFRSSQSTEERKNRISEGELALFTETVEKVKALLRSHSHYADGSFFEKILGDIRGTLNAP